MTNAAGEPDGQTVEDAHRVPGIKPLKCYHPFRTLSVDRNGVAYACSCPSRRNPAAGPDGNTRTQSYEEIWNGDRLQDMRASFLEGDYAKYCDPSACSLLFDKPADPPEESEVMDAVAQGLTILPYGIRTLIHEIDRGCNLSCIHCRTGKIAVDREYTRRNVDEMKEIIEAGRIRTFYPHGSGEVLVMKDVVDLLASDLLAKNGIAVELHTNLLPLVPSVWQRIQHNSFNSVVFSADGCSSQTYDKVRRGGSWIHMLERIRFAAALRREGRIRRLTWAYCVMKSNHEDIGRAIELAQDLGIDQIYFQPLYGRSPGPGENIFEECDLEALDHCHEILERAGAFGAPHIYLGDTPFTGRQYRSFGYRLEAAQQLARSGEETLAERVVRELARDIRSGSVDVPHGIDAGTINWMRWMLSSNGPAGTTASGTPDRGLTAPFAVRIQPYPPAAPIPRSGRVFVYGAGAGGQTLVAQMPAADRHRVSGFIDSHTEGSVGTLPKYTLDGYLALRQPEDVLIVASMFRHEILARLEAAGIPECMVSQPPTS